MVGSDDPFPFNMVVPFRGTFVHFGEGSHLWFRVQWFGILKIHQLIDGPELQLTSLQVYISHHFPPQKRYNPYKLSGNLKNAQWKRKILYETTNGWIPAVCFQEIHVDSPLSNCFARRIKRLTAASPSPFYITEKRLAVTFQQVN